MFENASRKKFRFDTTQGSMTTEDLWDLPLTSTTKRACLDDIARDLYKKLNSEPNLSFVTDTASAEDTTTKQKFELVKYIIGVRLAENKTIQEKKVVQDKKRRLKELIEQKEDEALAQSSVEELIRMMESM